MSKRQFCVVPIRRESRVSEADDLVIEVAYGLWLSSAFHGGSPEEALLTALQMVRGQGTAGLFLVPNRKPQSIQFMRPDDARVSR